MRRNLPQQYREDPWVIALTSAMQGVMEKQERRSGEITVQQFLSSVTWNLPVEERIAGLVPSFGATDEERRTALKAKWRSGGKLSIEQLQAVADSWQDGAVDVTFPKGRIIVQFAGEFGIPANMDALKAALRGVVPAHLPIDYRFRYILVRDIKIMTLGELQQQKIQNFAFRREASHERFDKDPGVI